MRHHRSSNMHTKNNSQYSHMQNGMLPASSTKPVQSATMRPTLTTTRYSHPPRECGAAYSSMLAESTALDRWNHLLYMHLCHATSTRSVIQYHVRHCNMLSHSRAVERMEPRVCITVGRAKPSSCVRLSVGKAVRRCFGCARASQRVALHLVADGKL